MPRQGGEMVHSDLHQVQAQSKVGGGGKDCGKWDSASVEPSEIPKDVSRVKDV